MHLTTERNDERELKNNRTGLPGAIFMEQQILGSQYTINLQLISRGSLSPALIRN